MAGEHDEHQERRARSLTDADIEALANILEERLADRFYNNLGRGVWAMAKRGVVIVVLALAGYGAFTKIGGGHG